MSSSSPACTASTGPAGAPARTEPGSGTENTGSSREGPPRSSSRGSGDSGSR
ncbi:hypothetical protein ACFQ60_33810 [Streptomyces zhihengii]